MITHLKEIMCCEREQSAASLEKVARPPPPILACWRVKRNRKPQGQRPGGSKVLCKARGEGGRDLSPPTWWTFLKALCLITVESPNHRWAVWKTRAYSQTKVKKIKNIPASQRIPKSYPSRFFSGCSHTIFFNQSEISGHIQLYFPENKT